ncbi:MAG: (4Fe-4S)-binding protein [Bacteroidota bacterium]
MSQEIIKEYTNGDLTVVWKPKKCIHSEICVKTLPQVYDPNARPWIQPENATIEALQAQIDQCPSGALTYKMKGVEPTAASTAATHIAVMQNGPLIVNGEIELTDANGNTTTKAGKTALCRCGHSQNKPYCDGAHARVGFEG